MQTNVRGALEELLRRRRSALIREATERETALRANAGEGESEFEEGAQEEQSDGMLSRLDDRERHEIAEINAALDRLADGTYGRCTRCDAPIEIDRLAALPETALCLRCAIALEARHAAVAPATMQSGTVPGDLALLSDDEIEASIREAVEADERIDDEELRISCRRGIVHLDGVLPSEAERTVVRRIVEDVLGFRDVVDRVRIDEVPWERAERYKPTAQRATGYEPSATTDAVESTDEGISFVPADRPPPEED